MYGTNRSFMVSTSLFHIAIGPAGDSWDQHKSQIIDPKSKQSSTTNGFCQKHASTNIEQLAISIHPEEKEN